MNYKYSFLNMSNFWNKYYGHFWKWCARFGKYYANLDTLTTFHYFCIFFEVLRNSDMFSAKLNVKTANFSAKKVLENAKF